MPNKTWRALLEEWGLTSLKVNVGVASAEFRAQDADRQAAWELYVELLTRITTQPLPDGHGDETAALKSVHSLFALTREILRRNGSDCIEFTKLAVVVLNQLVRPFTAKWHGIVAKNPQALEDEFHSTRFRADLKLLQAELTKVQKALAAIAMVEDLTHLEG